jgi:hypothetical protein
MKIGRPALRLRGRWLSNSHERECRDVSCGRQGDFHCDLRVLCLGVMLPTLERLLE